jgi:hypothetical protein
MSDLIVSAVQNYGWPKLRAYANSLARCGFEGTKLMFVENVAQDCQENLRSLGFDVRPFSTKGLPSARRGQKLAFCNARYIPVIEFLKQNDFRYVIWTDTRDLVFQSNPSDWLDAHGAPLVAAGECWSIKGLPPSPNDTWVKYVATPEDYAWIREQEALCSGTIAGDTQTVLALMERMLDVSYAVDQVWGIDQGVYNCVVRQSPFKEVLRVPRMAEGFIATCSAFRTDSFASGVATLSLLIDEQPRFDRKNGVVRAPRTDAEFCIFHQYDRDDIWAVLIEAKYVGEAGEVRVDQGILPSVQR